MTDDKVIVELQIQKVYSIPMGIINIGSCDSCRFDVNISKCVLSSEFENCVYGQAHNFYSQNVDSVTLFLYRTVEEVCIHVCAAVTFCSDE